MIKDALSVLPTKPVVIIAPLIVLVVLTIYYWDRYASCQRSQTFRQSLNAALVTADSGVLFRLAEFTKFRWDRVRIIENFVPENERSACPFGWNWSRGEREAIMAAGDLTAMIFGWEGAIVAYHELRRDRVAFRGLESSLTPAQAVFRLGAGSDDGDAIRLSLQQWSNPGL